MTYSINIINLAISYYTSKIKIIKISKMLQVTRQTISIWIKQYKFNIINNTPITKSQLNENKFTHKNNKINKYSEKVKNFVDLNNGCNLNDIYLNINKEISKSSIVNLLKKINITNKKINNHIVCKDIEIIKDERKIFVKNINYDINNVIFIDESSFCINDIADYGYSTKGVKINKLLRHKHNKKRYTLLAAISNKNIVDFEIIDGSVNKNIYLDF